MFFFHRYGPHVILSFLEFLNQVLKLQYQLLVKYFLKCEKKSKCHGGHLEFQDGRQRHNSDIASIELNDLTNVCLDTKIVVL